MLFSANTTFLTIAGTNSFMLGMGSTMELNDFGVNAFLGNLRPKQNGSPWYMYRVPRSGTLRNLYFSAAMVMQTSEAVEFKCTVVTAPTPGDPPAVTSVDTTRTVSVTSLSTQFNSPGGVPGQLTYGANADLTHTVAVNAGDYVGVLLRITTVFGYFSANVTPHACFELV